MLKLLVCATGMEGWQDKSRKDEFSGAQLLLTIEQPNVQTDLSKAYVVIV